MKAEYQFEYKETKDVITQSLQVHGLTKVSMNFRVSVATIGILVLAFILYYSNVLKGSAGSIFLFSIKFIIGWALAFVIGEILARTLGRNITLGNAIREGEISYEKRTKNTKEPVSVKMEFYDDSWVSTVNGNEKRIIYGNVDKIVESEEILGLVARGEDGRRRLFGFPKAGLVNADIEEFKKFLLQRCQGVKKGIEVFNVK